MRIERLEIGAFGKFSDYNLELTDGLQIVFGGNEVGKTTLMDFIKMLFYSRLATPRSIKKNLRWKYQPWSGGAAMGGAVSFVQEGVRWRLQKEFGETPNRDRVRLWNLDIDQEVELGKNEEAGKRFFGLDLEGFERSSFIGQIGSVDAVNGHDDLAESLIRNLTQSGDESIPKQQVLDNLKKAREELITKNEKDGKLVAARRQLQEWEKEKARVEYVSHQQNEIMAAYEALQNQHFAQKRLRDQLEAMQARTRAEQITGILTLYQDIAARRAALERPGLHIEAMEDYLTGLEEAYNDYQAAEQAHQEISQTEPIHNPEAAVITEEEFRTAEKLCQRGLDLQDIRTGFDTLILPTMVDYEAKQRQYTDFEERLRDIVQRQPSFASDERRVEEAEQEQERLSDMLQSYRQDRDKERERWDHERSLLQADVDAADSAIAQAQTTISGLARRRVKTKPETVKSSTFNKNTILLLAVAVLVMLIAVATSVFFENKLFLAALGLEIVPFFLIARTGKTKEKEDKEKDKEKESREGGKSADLWAAQKLEEAIAESNRQKEALRRKETEFRERDKAIEAKISQTQEKLEESDRMLLGVTSRLNDLNSLRQEADRVRAEQKQYQNIIQEIEKKYLSHANYLNPLLRKAGFAILPESPNPHVTVAAEALTTAMRGVNTKLEKFLVQKNCKDMAELRFGYMNYQTTVQKRLALQDMETRLRRMESRVCTYASTYSPVAKAKEAEELLIRLRAELKVYTKLEDEIKHRMESLGLSGFRPEELAQQRMKLESMAGTVQFTAEELERISLSYNEVRGEDYSGKMLELRKQLHSPEHSLDQLEEWIGEQEQKVKEMEMYYDGLALTEEIMEEAAEELRSMLSPELNALTGKILAELTGDRYEQVSVTKDYSIQVKSGAYYREYGYLSNGAVDQVYLALRLALTQLISGNGEPLPVFLDDALMQYDDERLRMALGFLSRFGKDTQILLFTCHRYVAEQAEKFQTVCHVLP
jgi:uncharacterized protein YhaN